MPGILSVPTLSAAQRRRAHDVALLALQHPLEHRHDFVSTACADDPLVRGVVLDTVASAPPALASAGADDGVTDTSRTHLAAGGADGTPVPAARWGDFVLFEELGRGGFGVVYRAWDAALQRDVALKLVNLDRLPDASGASLLHEGQLLARIRHPNVVTVFSATRIGGQVGLAMEYIRGETLSTLLARQGPMSAREAAVVGVALCRALATVHRNGLIHRDVKASNVMREHGGRIVLMDFGAGRESSLVDVASEVVGTPLYMAPEILRGAEVSPASDVYSLGVLLYHLVTCAYPVNGDDLAQLLSEFRVHSARSLAEVRPELPSSFVRVVDRALRHDPGARFGSAGAMRRALDGALRSGSQALQRHTITATPQTLDRAPWFRWVLGGGALLAGPPALAGLLGFVTTQAFNRMLGRTGAFADEHAIDILVVGARSMIAPAVTIAAGFLVAALAHVAVRFLAGAWPSLAHRVGAYQARVREALGERLDDAATGALLTCALASAGLGGILWGFRALVGAFMSRADIGAVSDLAQLASTHVETHVLYRLAVEAVVLVIVAGLVGVAGAMRRRSQAVPIAGIGGCAAALVIALVLLAVPWRMLWSNTFPRAQMDGRSCYVIGTTADDHLLLCPAHEPPRTRVIRRGDPRVTPSETVGRPFDEFAQVAR